MTNLQATRGASPDDAGSARSLMGRQETPVSLRKGADKIPVCPRRKIPSQLDESVALRSNNSSACRVGCALPA